MKRHILVLIIALISVKICNGQDQKTNNLILNYNGEKNGNIIERIGEKPLFAKHLLAGPHDFIKGRFIRTPEETMKYGINDGDFLVETLKPGLEIVTVQKIYEMFHVSEEDQQLPLYVDGYPFSNAKNFVVVKSSIKSISGMISKITNERVMNMVTTNPPPRSEPVN